jgi:hypothetical protein
MAPPTGAEAKKTLPAGALLVDLRQRKSFSIFEVGLVDFALAIRVEQPC